MGKFNHDRMGNSIYGRKKKIGTSNNKKIENFKRQFTTTFRNI